MDWVMRLESQINSIKRYFELYIWKTIYIYHDNSLNVCISLFI